MNHKKIYDSIIENRLKNKLKKTYECYTEVHHIKPKSLFTKDAKTSTINRNTNLIRLTSKEHFICHCLLAKMYKKGTNKWFKMNHSIKMMKLNKNNKRYTNSRLYESIKNDFFNELNTKHEKQTLKSINEICDFIDMYKRNPKTRASNNYEKVLGRKLIQLRQNKSKLIRPFYNSYQLLAESRGYTNLFNITTKKQLEEKTLNKIHNWLTENKREPSYNSNGEEKIIYNAISKIKSKCNKCYGIPNKYIDIFNKIKYSHIFLTLEENGINNINEICDFIDINHREPSSSKKSNDYEMTLFNKLHNLRYGKQGKGTVKFHKSYQDLVKKRGYSKIFEIL